MGRGEGVEEVEGDGDVGNGMFCSIRPVMRFFIGF